MPVEPSVFLDIPHFTQEKDYSCVAACARMALKYFHIDRSESDLRRLLDTRSPLGTPFANLSRIVGQPWELRVYLGTLDLEQIVEAMARKSVAIIFLRTKALSYWNGQDEFHAVIVSAVDHQNDQILINDPWFSTGPSTASIQSFLQAWSETENLTVILA